MKKFSLVLTSNHTQRRQSLSSSRTLTTKNLQISLANMRIILQTITSFADKWSSNKMKNYSNWIERKENKVDQNHKQKLTSVLTLIENITLKECAINATTITVVHKWQLNALTLTKRHTLWKYVLLATKSKHSSRTTTRKSEKENRISSTTI